MQNFPDSLKSSRLSARMTQLDAADYLRISRRSLQHWEQGKILPVYPAQVGSISLLESRVTRNLQLDAPTLSNPA